MAQQIGQAADSVGVDVVFLHAPEAIGHVDSVGYLRMDSVCYYHRIMTLNDYLKSPGSMSVSALREAIGAKSDMQIRQWQHGYADRSPSPENCVALERATNGAGTRRDLRPTDWPRIWPELVTPEHPAPIAEAQG